MPNSLHTFILAYCTYTQTGPSHLRSGTLILALHQALIPLPMAGTPCPPETKSRDRLEYRTEEEDHVSATTQIRFHRVFVIKTPTCFDEITEIWNAPTDFIMVGPTARDEAKPSEDNHTATIQETHR
jgi:hypothetical protein